MKKEQYKVHLESFEGPLDLLLHLIEKNRIGHLRYSHCTFNGAVHGPIWRNSREFNIEIASEFLVIAATLLQIKSKILLPDTKIETETTDEEETDPAAGNWWNACSNTAAIRKSAVC